MFGIRFAQDAAAAATGSSCRNRMATSNVAPPHISRLYRLCSRCATKLAMPQHVVRSHPRRQQRLVRVAERGIGQQQVLLRARPLREFLRPHRLQQLARAVRRRRTCRASERRRRVDPLAARLARHRRIVVDDHIAQIASAAWSRGRCRCAKRNSSGVSSSQRVVTLAGLEIRMVDHVLQERDVRLHAAHAELPQRPVHALAGVPEIAVPTPSSSPAANRNKE